MLLESWEELFQDKESRHIYMDEFLNAYLGMQIKVLREQRNWTQAKLGKEADMKQTRISVLESMDYSSWSLDVLRRIAKAFDLRLVVKFEDFSSYVKDYFELERKHLERNSYDNDLIFSKEVREKAVELLDSTANTKRTRTETDSILDAEIIEDSQFFTPGLGYKKVDTNLLEQIWFDETKFREKDGTGGIENKQTGKTPMPVRKGFDNTHLVRR